MKPAPGAGGAANTGASAAAGGGAAGSGAAASAGADALVCAEADINALSTEELCAIRQRRNKESISTCVLKK